MRLKKFDNDRQVAYGEVYTPNVIDSHGHFMTEDTVAEMAHGAMLSGTFSKIDVQHDNDEIDAVPVESFIARDGDPDFIPGAWVMGVHIRDSAVWKAVKSNEIAGFSIEVMGKLVEREVEIELPERVVGKTLEDSTGHVHTYYAELDDEGQIVGGYTNEVDGHSHNISKSSTTDRGEDHQHRYHYIDDLLKGAVD